MKKRQSKFAKCPFYRGETEKTVSCESAICQISTIQIFQSPKQKTEYEKDYCYTIKCWQGCPHAQMCGDNNE